MLAGPDPLVVLHMPGECTQDEFSSILLVPDLHTVPVLRFWQYTGSDLV